MTYKKLTDGSSKVIATVDASRSRIEESKLTDRRPTVHMEEAFDEYGNKILQQSSSVHVQ